MVAKRIHIFVSGRVQGVFYRLFVKKAAANLKIKGWVKNLGDGRVEIVAEGEEHSISQFAAECNKGPIIAHIDDVDMRYETPMNKFKDFSITY